MSAEILNFPAAKVLELYKKKSLSPVEVIDAVISQIEKYQPSLNPFVVTADKDTLLKAAKESETRWIKGTPAGMIDGIPVTIKDDAGVAGWPMREGSLTTSDAPLKQDAPQPARLREAGAIFLGKTALPEFGHKGVTDSPVSGITRNPWNSGKTTGGSSGGEGVAAATGMGYLHLGSDGGGSIRIPSSFCGVFGLKPTTCTVPEWPASPFSGMATSGPLARHAEDAALMMDIITQPDARDWHALPYQKRDFAKNIGQIPRNLKIAYAPTVNGTPVAPEVARCVAETAKKFQSIGTVEEISLEVPRFVDIWNKHWMAIAAWALSMTPAEKRKLMDPYFLEWAERGQKMDLNEYVCAMVDRMAVGEQMQALLNKYDLLLLPTMPQTAFNIGQNVANDADGKPWLDWTPFTFLANLTKLPAASIPCGLSARDNMPVGAQILSGSMKDGLILNVCHALEKEIGFQSWLERSLMEEAPARKKAAG